MQLRILVTALAVCLWAPAAAADEIEQSVVRIINHSQRGEWFTPWSSTSTRKASGSGFVIEGGKVMTNAHVVSDTRMLLLYLHGDPTPHEARVYAVGHDCDLALIEPVEEGLLDDLPSLSFSGGLPELRSTVETIGYPAGGQRLSITTGVVSRIEVSAYSHSAVDGHLTVQTDAAINPGNSGGPVIQDGGVVGVAFQGIAGLDNVGFFIPAEVVQHFLDDSADGLVDGFPETGVITTNMENPAARARAGMGSDDSGVRVEFIHPQSSAEGHLEIGDVIVEVEGHDVANDTTVAIGDLRLNVGLLFDRLQKGESASLVVLRDGQRLDVSVPMNGYVPQRKLGHIYDELPRYYIYAGLVFVELSREVLKTFGSEWYSKASTRLLYEFLFRQLEDPPEQRGGRVVLLRRMDHAVNADMAWFRNRIVETVNGQEVHDLEELIVQIESAEGPYQVFEFDHYGCFGVLDRAEAEEAHATILQQYDIPEDRRL